MTRVHLGGAPVSCRVVTLLDGTVCTIQMANATPELSDAALQAFQDFVNAIRELPEEPTVVPF